MNTLLIACIILWILTVACQGISMISIGTLISTVLFCSRKVGHFCKLNTLIVIECVSLFLGIVWQILFKDINWFKVILCIALRLIFLAVCYYDTKEWIYVKEVHRKED